jgi:hypothetical protein
VKAEVDKLEAERVRLAELNNKLNHTARSDAGRVAALTKRVEELSRVAKAAGSAEAQKRKALFEKFEADYPEIAAAMKAQAEEQEDRITQAQQTAEALAQDGTPRRPGGARRRKSRRSQGLEGHRQVARIQGLAGAAAAGCARSWGERRAG